MISTTITAILLTQNSVFIHKPYLQLGFAPTGSSLDLVWHAADAKDFSVEYTSRSGKKTARPTTNRILVGPSAPFESYTAELTNLPAGEFTYSVKKGDQVVFTSKAVGPKPNAKRWRLVAFGDAGTGGPDQAAISHMSYLKKPDLVLMTGDNVYDDGTVTEYDKFFWPYFAAEKPDPKVGSPMIQEIPTVAAPGNHDFGSSDLTKYPDGLAYFYFWRQPLNGPALKVGGANTPNARGASLDKFLAMAKETYPKMANFSFDYGNAHFVVLDSNPTANFGDAQLREWLTNDLKNVKPGMWKIVSYHHPAFHSSAKHAADKRLRIIADLLNKQKVDLVLNGHVHNYQRSKPILESHKALIKSSLEANDWKTDEVFDGEKHKDTNGLIHIVTGAGGRGLYEPQYENDKSKWQPYQAQYKGQFSFSQIDFDGDSLSFKQIDGRGNVIDQWTLNRKR